MSPLQTALHLARTWVARQRRAGQWRYQVAAAVNMAIIIAGTYIAGLELADYSILERSLPLAAISLSATVAVLLSARLGKWTSAAALGVFWAGTLYTLSRVMPTCYELHTGRAYRCPTQVVAGDLVAAALIPLATYACWRYLATIGKAVRFVASRTYTLINRIFAQLGRGS